MVPELFVIGLLVGIFYHELAGYSPGGVVPPAYFALFIGHPERLAATVVLAVGVFVAVRILQARTLLYGRRRLAMALLLGLAGKWLVEYWAAPQAGLPFEIQAIGYVVPGLVANDMARQGVLPTVLSLGIAMILTALIALLLGVKAS